MKEQFKGYLIKRGYNEFTPSGNPSTAYSYVKYIDRVCEWECIEWSELADNIDVIIDLYDIGGAKEEQGNMSKRTCINALKRFSEFLPTYKGAMR